MKEKKHYGNVKKLYYYLVKIIICMINKIGTITLCMQ